ncbi:hypothetical protein BKA83DRAFT_4129363 [Pisolithus microcarpus]|nr:hypothetical protein BKA83DRAFT_4129363 [Pisolithus microcarpus]
MWYYSYDRGRVPHSLQRERGEGKESKETARMIQRRASFSELVIGELSLASRIQRVHAYDEVPYGNWVLMDSARHSRRRFLLPRPRNQSPNMTTTQKIRTDDVVCLRFGKQYETVHIETIKAIKHTSEPGIRAHA